MHSTLCGMLLAQLQVPWWHKPAALAVQTGAPAAACAAGPSAALTKRRTSMQMQDLLMLVCMRRPTACPMAQHAVHITAF